MKAWDVWFTCEKHAAECAALPNVEPYGRPYQETRDCDVHGCDAKATRALRKPLEEQA